METTEYYGGERIYIITEHACGPQGILTVKCMDGGGGKYLVLTIDGEAAFDTPEELYDLIKNAWEKLQ